METLNAYLDSMFAAWPRTAQVADLKRDMLAAMEDKYDELKRTGRSEHEVIGIVISEFGSVDELMGELGISPADERQAAPKLTEASALGYEAFVRRSSLLKGIGWMLVLLGAAAMVLIAALNENGALGALSEDAGYLLAVIALFVLVVPAIGLFIASGGGKESYGVLSGDFELAAGTRGIIESHRESFRPIRSRSVVAAACLGTLSPVAVLIAAMNGEGQTPYGVSVMLALLSLMLFLFVYYGGIHEGYEKLLQLGEFTPTKKEENRVLGRIAAVVWPLAFIVFFVSGFVYGRWDVNWAVFPVTAVLFGAIGGVYGLRAKTKQKA
ncbi:permease prefix domain 1-containing protein [Saccharibacillus sp. CPCC 101409]|uniref:permease prefix domain 1-containing protein n=1 Tax=Saccharibacillus sp. CPCC 101409 TaxID=3058041 RepID=UPI002673E3FE|nr:permease prefix domain 1-containing protein [Saccharibacillus sp. CPCC 101409]MDO3408805.1 permease prefix domain 1-containing protein [Saccharibacillus sp. CPCC 101409]